MIVTLAKKKQNTEINTYQFSRGNSLGFQGIEETNEKKTFDGENNSEVCMQVHTIKIRRQQQMGKHDKE